MIRACAQLTPLTLISAPAPSGAASTGSSWAEGVRAWSSLGRAGSRWVAGRAAMMIRARGASRVRVGDGAAIVICAHARALANGTAGTGSSWAKAVRAWLPLGRGGSRGVPPLMLICNPGAQCGSACALGTAVLLRFAIEVRSWCALVAVLLLKYCDLQSRCAVRARWRRRCFWVL